MAKNLEDIKVWYWKPGDEFPDDKDVARWLFIRVSFELEVPESAWPAMLAQFREFGGKWRTDPVRKFFQIMYEVGIDNKMHRLPELGFPPETFVEPAEIGRTLELPLWYYRIQSPSDYRRLCRAKLDAYLDSEIENFERILAERGFFKAKEHQQPRTLVNDLKLLAEYWLMGRSPQGLSKDMERRGYKEPTSTLWKALKRAQRALGLKRLPEQIRNDSRRLPAVE